MDTCIPVRSAVVYSDIHMNIKIPVTREVFLLVKNSKSEDYPA